MGDESSGCDAIVGGLVAKLQSDKVTKVCRGALLCVSAKIGKFNLAKARRRRVF